MCKRGFMENFPNSFGRTDVYVLQNIALNPLLGGLQDAEDLVEKLLIRNVAGAFV